MTQAENLVALLKATGKTCATAESCTGGKAGAAITSVSGASDVYLGGVVSYANSVKHSVLGVSREILSSCGAVSEECAIAMAEGVRLLTGADIAVSVTGIAGPGGATADKPVGLVWFARATADGTMAEKAIFAGGREEVRDKAVAHALGLMMTAAI